MKSPIIYIFDLGGVLIRLNVGRCMRAFEALMGEENMRAVLGMDSNGEGVKAVDFINRTYRLAAEQTVSWITFSSIDELLNTPKSLTI